jgi:hypothetical protein
MAGFFMKLFRAGKFPPELAAAAQQSPLLAAEQVTLKASGKLNTPARRSSGFTAMHGGGLVILPGRVLASFGRDVIVDDQPGAEVPADACTTCTIDGSGLRITIDVARLIPGGTGNVDVEVRVPIPPDVLAALPVHQWQGRVAAADPQLVLRRI